MAAKMILMFSVKPEKREEFIELANSVLPDTRSYEGNLKVNVWIPEDDDGQVWLYEEWESKEHQEKYFQWRLDTGLMDAIGPFLTADPRIAWLVDRN